MPYISSDSPTKPRVQALAPYLVAGAASAILGLLPWLLTGLRLPLQNLWGSSALEMPFVMLPFSQYTIILLAAMMVVGAAIAGGFARYARGRMPRLGFTAIVAGVVGLQAIATAQTAVTVASGLQQSTSARVYLAVLVAGSAVAIALGLLVLWLIARGRVPAVVIGLSIAGVAAGSWLGRVVVPFGSLASDIQLTLLSAVYWVPAIIVGLAIVWAGLGSIGRVAADVIGLLLLWIAPAAITGFSAATGSRVLVRYPADMLEYGSQVFLLALGPAGGTPRLLIAASVVIVVGLAVRWALRRRELEASRLSESN